MLKWMVFAVGVVVVIVGLAFGTQILVVIGGVVAVFAAFAALLLGEQTAGDLARDHPGRPPRDDE